MQVEWIEGEWSTGEDGKPRPVEPKDCWFFWYAIDTRWNRIHCTNVRSIDMILLSVHYGNVAATEKEGKPEPDPPRWWYSPMEEPDNLPAEHPRITGEPNLRG